MLKQCGYYRKSIDECKEVKNTLLYLIGSQLARKENEYYSMQCAEYDQMAHES
ncbi:DNA breaking-rejoining protein [Salmonella enterica subsp. enterica serovar Typhimurium]|uniref:YdaE family protein n=1 Tax=Salmonella enterica TaxID=28901 RepID=UPI00084B2F49|nr:YdaE family protein [Salmonella enterica]OEC12313.1 DNA breaking-rejoining protein [Salmonella enterica subsp. enterica serovar Typhimurium]